MRKILKKIHLYLALVLCFPLILQGLSGAILVFDHEISRRFSFSDHEFSSQNIRPIDEIISAAKDKTPEGFKANFIKIDDAATVRFSKKVDEKNVNLEVALDPASLEILLVRNPQDNPLNTIKRFHTNLLIQGPLGRNFIGYYGFTMLFMAISGLVIWFPKKGMRSKEMFRRILTFKLSSTGKKLYRDLHASIGAWASIFILISSFSGVYLAFPQGTGNFIATIFHGKNFAAANSIKAEPLVADLKVEALKIDDAIEIAKNALGQDLEFVSSGIPTKPDQPFRINFAEKNHQDGAPFTTAFIDPWSKKIIEKREPNNYSLSESIISWQSPLHEGRGLGLIWSVIVFLVGFLPLFFSITGIAMWWLKKGKK